MERWSPNRSSRGGRAVDTIILHATASDSLAGAVAWFLDPKSRVSAHYVIGKAGEVVKLVPLSETAWHAGRSLHPVGGGLVNGRSVGIELVNRNDGKDPYPAAQLAAVRRLVAEIRSALSIRYLYSHARVAVPRGRKTDPAGLNCRALAAELGLEGA